MTKRVCKVLHRTIGLTFKEPVEQASLGKSSFLKKSGRDTAWVDRKGAGGAAKAYNG